jgi:tetratricopeptide (TPR) repeat protein
VFYERDQTQEAIDAYQAISRRSPAFGDALQEIAWVYVKAKQYDRALRALELLQLASPKASDLPEIRLLEGNLRLRKAQGMGTEGLGNTTEEYAKATKLFEQTRDVYEKSKDEIDKLLAAHGDRKAYFNAVTGKGGEALDVQVEVPKAALDAVREEPEAGRVVVVTKTLDEVRAELDDAAKGIARLERAVASPSRVRIFPDLASRRAQAEEIHEGLVRIRTSLGNDERVLVVGKLSAAEQGELQRVQGQREGLTRKLAALPNSGDGYEERVRKAREAVEDVDKRAKEVEVFLYSLDAQMVALERYYATAPGKKMTPEQFERERKPIRDDIAALRAQLESFHHDTELLADEAGIGDELAVEEQDLRRQLDEAIRAEHTLVARAAARAGGDEAARVQAIESLLARADNVEKAMARVNGRIDQAVEGQLREVKVAIAEEKAELVGYQQQLASYDGETVDVGSDVVAGSFGRVAKKFKDIVVRSDVGLVDVPWAQVEQAQKFSDRLRIDFAREKTMLDAEFHDVLTDEKPAESAPPKPQEKQP